MRLFKRNNPAPIGETASPFIWRDMYENGGRLKLAPTISAEVAKLVTLEFSGKIHGSKRAEVINEAFKSVTKNIRNISETACALGSVILKPYFDGTKIATSFVPADGYEILSVTPSGEISGIRFYERVTYKGIRFVKHEEHKMGKGFYTISNSAYKDSDGVLENVPLKSVPAWSDLEEEATVRNLNVPLFARFSLPNSVPIYARSRELIEDAEKQYERILWEYESGERALYVDETAVLRNERKEASLPGRRLYRMLNTGDDALFEDWTPELRHEPLFYGLDRIFKRIEFNSGLAYGTISDQTTVEKTAEEIRSSKQRSYATVLEIQTLLKTAIIEWAKATDALCDIYGLATSGEYTVDLAFDDSIIADRNREFEERLELLKNGVITAEEMRWWYMGEGDKNES